MMKTPINFLRIPCILLLLCLAACSNSEEGESPNNEASGYIFEDHLAMKHKTEPVGPDRIEKTSTGSTVLSWIIEDDVIIQRRELREPVVSITSKDNEITGIYITEGGLRNSFVYEDNIIFREVYEDNVMFSYVFEDHVILRSDNLNDIQLGWVTEDIIIFLEFVLEDHIMMRSGLVQQKNTVQLQVFEPKSSTVAEMDVSHTEDTLDYTLYLQGSGVNNLPETLQMMVSKESAVTLQLSQSEDDRVSYKAKMPVSALGESSDATMHVEFEGHTIYSGYFTIREDIL